MFAAVHVVLQGSGASLQAAEHGADCCGSGSRLQELCGTDCVFGEEGKRSESQPRLVRHAQSVCVVLFSIPFNARYALLKSLAAASYTSERNFDKAKQVLDEVQGKGEDRFFG